MVVLVVILIVHLLQGGNSQANLSANTGQPGASGGAGPSGAQPASQGLVIPAAFNGTWSGQVSQVQATFNVTVTLSTGGSSGAISYNGAATCSGTLTPTSVSGSRMVMKITIVQGRQQCGNGGTATLTVKGAGALAFVGGQGASATGTLIR